jgi:hypothetical protein
MWCDGCCLLFPLRVGALVWNAIILLYSAVGGYLLVTYGGFWCECSPVTRRHLTG